MMDWFYFPISYTPCLGNATLPYVGDGSDRQHIRIAMLPTERSPLGGVAYT